MGAIATVLCSPHGRIGRRTFWIGVVGLTAANLLGAALPAVGTLISLLALWPLTCLLIKRLHDMGRAGVLALAPLVAMVALTGLSAASALMAMNAALVPLALAMAGGTALIGLLAALVVVGFILWVGLTPGHDGANAYGAPEALPLTF